MTLGPDYDSTGACFTLPLTGDMGLYRFDASFRPPDNFIGVRGSADWRSGGKFKDGQSCASSGKPFNRPVTYWVGMEKRDA